MSNGTDWYAERILPILTLFEYLVCFTLSAFALLIFSRLLWVVRCDPLRSMPPMLLLFTTSEICQSIASCIHALYLLLFWQYSHVAYNAFLIYGTGLFSSIATICVNISLWFLGLDRCVCILAPLYHRRHSQWPMAALAFGTFVVIISSAYALNVLPWPPKNAKTTCRSYGCLGSNQIVERYAMLRASIGGINFGMGCILAVLLTTIKGTRKSKKHQLVLGSIIIDFAFNFTPHFIVFIVTLIGKSSPNPIMGAYGIVFRAANAFLVGTLYLRVFAKKSDRKRQENFHSLHALSDGIQRHSSTY